MKSQSNATLWTSTSEEWTKLFEGVQNRSVRDELVEAARQLKNDELKREEATQFHNTASESTLKQIAY